MRIDVLKLFAKQTYLTVFKNKAIMLLLGIIVALLVYAAISGATIYKQQTESRLQYQKQVRENWEKMPDKHPHRMAHYGYLVFRTKHPLSFFDFGMESYTGNAVFLEAHRQNTFNFSEAGFSTGMLRFGEISMSMVLQLLLPLVVFFIGFNTVATDRENGTLKILLSQGVSWKEIIVGKAAGLLGISLSILVLAIVILVIGCITLSPETPGVDALGRAGWLSLFYGMYFAIISVIPVLISAVSKTAKVSLISLIAIWLLSAVIFPRTTQALGNMLYPSPAIAEFQAAVEKDLIKTGDSHNPDDPYYKALKDSILRVYNVSSIEQLPFNYSGFQMKEGERISSELYNQHLERLLQTYEKQNALARISTFLNPMAAVRNISMAISGTDFNAYTGFQRQAETYRYRLAQHMNELQIKLISNKKLSDHDKPYSISHNHWKSFPDFKYKFADLHKLMKQEAFSLMALLGWIVLLGLLIVILSKRLKAI
ncbi:ABC transporter permease [Sphingobacterium athyrii]|uniref:ABC transporter permease n=1 Tax=Sphingobacterium athyrii TaxID=2152717 RepID=UPI0028AC1081|nr:DUF3526 domain-containing protein [Sphingobacterium athyrii]